MIFVFIIKADSWCSKKKVIKKNLITHEDFSKIESTESLLKKFLYMP
jgi:hypothetical protein